LNSRPQCCWACCNYKHYALPTELQEHFLFSQITLWARLFCFIFNITKIAHLQSQIWMQTLLFMSWTCRCSIFSVINLNIVYKINKLKILGTLNWDKRITRFQLVTIHEPRYKKIIELYKWRNPIIYRWF
jgi:hypothetical protein